MTAAERLTEYVQTPVRFTADEFMELIKHPPIADWTGKIELVEGEIVRMAPANIPHWRVRHDTAQKLKLAYGDAGSAWLVGPEPTIRFIDRTIRLLDVGVLYRPNLAQPIFLVADLFLALEVADTTLRVDLGPKLLAYAAAGVPHYWVVDLNARRVIVHEEPRADGYGDARTIPFGEPLAVPGTDAAIVID